MDQSSKYKSSKPKPLIKNTGVNLHDLGFGNEFLDNTKGTNNKRKKQINWTLSKLKALCIKKCYQENEKISYNTRENLCISYKGLPSKMY